MGTIAENCGKTNDDKYCQGTAGTALGSATAGIAVAVIQPDGANDDPKPQALVKGSSTDCVEAKADPSDLITTATAVAHALCQARGTKPQIFDTVTGQETEHLLQDPDFKRFTVLIATGKQPKDDNEKTQKAALKSIFGSDKPDLHKSHLDNLSQTQITLNHGDKPQTLTLAQISTSTDASDAIALFFNKAMHKQTTSKCAKEADVKTKDKCKADTEKDKCTEDKNCEHKDGK
ncbi:hypothetical protein DPX39_110149500 [Trypanosoma brucei equiperdum]|uniref:Trypanosome variant surface glycoprotein A-type N-terminal domain-containing protein n=1 Tax=Trypanosoma brucei equiperdum TaxID=630700 RepID=A0A3L6KV72_9TRYP|nr:hypothetical protein DPX39_110149500 [Trypanosoma brucei equiperdum]